MQWHDLILPSSTFDYQRKLFTALAVGGGIHEQNCTGCKRNRWCDNFLAAYQGGNFIKTRK
ncbi:hypothetical protein FDUTEX481_04697 [Tolypothrix sp. PCC 7601]|nr:hypothetical protein FDUTEX481_04697 [Tolypothrix sp. PCC 7601]